MVASVLLPVEVEHSVQAAPANTLRCPWCQWLQQQRLKFLCLFEHHGALVVHPDAELRIAQAHARCLQAVADSTPPSASLRPIQRAQRAGGRVQMKRFFCASSNGRPRRCAPRSGYPEGRPGSSGCRPGAADRTGQIWTIRRSCTAACQRREVDAAPDAAFEDADARRNQVDGQPYACVNGTPISIWRCGSPTGSSALDPEWQTVPSSIGAKTRAADAVPVPGRGNRPREGSAACGHRTPRSAVRRLPWPWSRPPRESASW